jgi:hypothetical protein
MNYKEQAKKLVSLGSLFSVLKQKYKDTSIFKYKSKSDLKQVYF